MERDVYRNKINEPIRDPDDFEYGELPMDLEAGHTYSHGIENGPDLPHEVWEQIPPGQRRRLVDVHVDRNGRVLWWSRSI